MVGAYGLLLPRPILDAPRLGCINLHASLLPRWRGAAPIERAILAGDAETGISIFRWRRAWTPARSTPCGASPIGAGTHRRASCTTLWPHSPRAMLPGRVVDELAAGTLPAAPQPEDGVTYAAQARRGTRAGSTSAEPADADRAPAARAEPRARLLVRGRGERLTLLARRAWSPGDGAPGTVLALPLTIACGSGALAVTQLQRAGRRPMPPDELLRGFALPAGHAARLSRCRATACCSNMTAGRSAAGSARPTARRCRRR